MTSLPTLYVARVLSCASVLSIQALLSLGCGSDGVGPKTSDLVLSVKAAPADTLRIIEWQDLVVQLSNRQGAPARNFIEFSVVEGLADLSATRVLTNETGTAHIRFMPFSGGLVRVQGRLSHSDLTITVDVHVTILNESRDFPVHVAPGQSPSVSPDGTKIALVKSFRATGALQVYDLNGPLLWTSADSVMGTEPEWSPDGRVLVYSTGTSIATLDLAGGRGPRVIRSPDGSYQHRYTSPTWSPDGQWIAYEEHQGETRTDRIGVMSADGSDPRAITEYFGYRSPAWSPRGDRIACEGAGEILILDLEGNITSNLTASWDEWATEPSWAPDGDQIVFQTDRNKSGVRLAIARVSTGSVRLVLAFMEFALRPTWSPSGDKILFQSASLNYSWSVFFLSTNWRE